MRSSPLASRISNPYQAVSRRKLIEKDLKTLGLCWQFIVENERKIRQPLPDSIRQSSRRPHLHGRRYTYIIYDPENRNILAEAPEFMQAAEMALDLVENWPVPEEEAA